MKNFFKDYIELVKTTQAANFDFVKNHAGGLAIFTLATFAVCTVVAAVPYVAEKREEIRRQAELRRQAEEIEEDENDIKIEMK